MIVKAFDSIDKVRLVSSGTEAVMTAIRLARGVTGRDMIIKFIGGYHGHVDHMLVSAGSGANDAGSPFQPGCAEGFRQAYAAGGHIMMRLPSFGLFAKYAGRIAAVIVEPVAGNMGVVPPRPEFLMQLRRLCTKNKALLIFDEVITGFRLCYGGAQTLYKVKPDLTTLGKIIGGGFPIGAVGGKAAIMNKLAPDGKNLPSGYPIRQSGLRSGRHRHAKSTQSPETL